MAAAVAVSGLLLVAGCAPTRAERTAAPAGPAAVPEPEPVDVRCGPDGVTVSGTTVRAGRAGVPVRVGGTAPAGTYLNIGWTHGGEGNPVPASPTVWTLAVPPGQLRLSCSNVEKREAVVTVVDPSSFWRPGTTADHSCPPGGIPSWKVGPGRGTSANAALADLTRQLSEYQGQPTSWRKLPVGYLDAPVSTWLLAVQGEPRITALVRRTGSEFKADPDALCGPLLR
ncbi:hypothetical protein AB0C02_05330 [Micromonospora sp. NPDC048999]|uniref:hypothetical protein n=1 Tax=Micromonospora sp. NPDC048999 TaxID=3155391 RepID=UPI00340B2CA1